MQWHEPLVPGLKARIIYSFIHLLTRSYLTFILAIKHASHTLQIHLILSNLSKTRA